MLSARLEDHDDDEDQFLDKNILSLKWITTVKS